RGGPTGPEAAHRGAGAARARQPADRRPARNGRHRPRGRHRQRRASSPGGRPAMRLNTRTVINVLVVLAVGASALVWAVVGLAGLRLFGDDRVTVQAVVSRAAGALPGAEVTYLGQSVGTVDRSEFVEEGILVTMDVELPDQVAPVLRADVRQKSALGEPYVDLAPAQADPDAPAGEVAALASSPRQVPAQEQDGARIPLERTSVPAELGQLLSDA